MYFKTVVIVLRQIKAKYVGEAGATSTFYAYAQAVFSGDIFLLADQTELVNGLFRQQDRRCDRRCIEQSFH